MSGLKTEKYMHRPIHRQKESHMYIGLTTSAAHEETAGLNSYNARAQQEAAGSNTLRGISGWAEYT